MREALTKLAGTIATTEQVMKHVDSGTAPALKRLPDMANQLQKTVANANKLLVSLDAGYGDNTKFNRDLERLMVQLNDAVTSIRSLADLLARHPEALVKGRPKGGVE
jgi:paraquat-inducible protein B